MEEVRQLVQEEGREARNLIAFHVAVDTPARVARKPPRAGAPPARRPAPRTPARLRSASAGRDKRSELRARYWALLFGDLQRAVGEIYNTVEAHENLNECQEVILVLENYTRDFKALGEWFRLKWEYDNTPPPQRPQSLAWEIRKTDFVRPESRRTTSVKSSPSVSGKNSPCLSGHNTPSGKNSPNLTGKASPGSGKMSPRIPGHSNTSPKGTIEFFSNKISSKIATKPEPKIGKETRLSDIKEKEVTVIDETDRDVKKENVQTENEEKELPKPVVEIGKAKELINAVPKQVIIKTQRRENLSSDTKREVIDDLSAQVKATIAKLDAMETEYLAKQTTETAAKNENMLNQDYEKDKTSISVCPEISDAMNLSLAESVDKDAVSTASPVKSEDNFGDISNESSKFCDAKLSTEAIDVDEKINETNKLSGNSLNEYESNGTNVPDTSNEKPVAKYHKIKEIKSLDSDKMEIDTSKTFTEEVRIESAKIEESDNKYKTKTNNIISKMSACENKDSKIATGDEKKEHLKKTETKITEHIITTKDGKKGDIKSAIETKPPVRPAYSQAAAKPKLVTAKTEVKGPNKTMMYRSKTVVEMRPASAPNRQMKQFPNRNPKNKCSYPFNLTTGRISLFDAPGNKVIATKRPISRPQMSSGDSRNQIKPDMKNRPPRPATLKLIEQKNANEKSNPALEKIKNSEEYSSSDTVVTQIDMSRIESSESLKTIVPEHEDDVANSIEVLNVDGDKNDNEGWLTVKSRRLSRESKKSKYYWANRFNQPSATTSLPTLNMIESPKSETGPIIDSKLDRAKSEQPQNKPEKIVKVAKPKSESKPKSASIIRQKSDVTGLKTRSSRNKALKREKNKDKKDSELTKNRLHSSLESLTTGLARSQESTEEEAFDFDKWKAEFMTTFKYLDEDDQMTNHNEILKTADPSEMSEIAEMTSQIEENERKISLALDFQSEADQKKLCQEEDLLNRQIMELQQVSDIDMDTETDDTETDAEILCEDSNIVSCESADNICLRSLTSCLERHYESALEGMSWAERVDMLGALEALVARDPGRAQQLHAKLSAGIKRRGSLQDVLRRLQAKQARAENQRMLLHTERAKKIHQLLARVEEVKVAKNQLIEEKRIRMERRLQKAAENRDAHLKDIVRKAHDEEEKLREIAFIKQLEAENRRHEFLEHCRANTARLREGRRERLSKLEQKAAREAAVGLRRQAIEAARKQHVESLLEKRKERDARVEELKELKKQERDDAAREKAEGVKSRLSALAAAAELEADALRSRIRDKQDASQQRLESHLQAIREKATITGPRQPTTSESQQEPTKETTKEQDEVAAKLEQERKEREKQKVLRKKARKLKQKILATCKDSRIIDNSVHTYNHTTSKIIKIINQMSNLLAPLINSEMAPKPTNCVDDEDKRNGTKTIRKPEIIENNNIDFKYDFEDKMGKKKKKKAKQAKQVSEKQASDVKASEAKPEQKLSKSNSICSSISDMSKASVKLEKTLLLLDMQLIEKLIADLYRLLVSKDMKESNELPMAKLPEAAIYTKLQTVKTLGQLFCVLAERDDLLSQLSTKSLVSLVTCACRSTASWRPAALLLFSSAAAPHLVSLLHAQLGKDIHGDCKELELAMQMTDLISVSLDAALCESRLHDEGEAVTAVRVRAHNLISYLCLSGCISRAESAGLARESMQTLVTLCADLCQPHPVDAGPERASAKQSLRCALGTSILGSRAEFCMLFARGAELARSKCFVRAARTAHLLRQLAELDHQIVQDAFGEGAWPLEFRAAVARLLSQHAPNDKEAPKTDSLQLSSQRLDHSLSEQMVLDLIVLVGYVVVNNPQLHETICENWGVIKTLCTLPANWLVSNPHCHSLLPTLVVLADHPDTADVIFSELSMKMLESYMNSSEGRKVKLIQILKHGREKTAKKSVSGKDKQKSANENTTKPNNIPNGSNDKHNGVVTNGVAKHDETDEESDGHQSEM